MKDLIEFAITKIRNLHRVLWERTRAYPEALLRPSSSIYLSLSRSQNGNNHSANYDRMILELESAYPLEKAIKKIFGIDFG
jgi:hypothetical protein